MYVVDYSLFHHALMEGWNILARYLWLDIDLNLKQLVLSTLVAYDNIINYAIEILMKFSVLAVQVCQCISHTLDLFLEQVALLRVRELESENNRLRFGRGWIANLFVAHEEIDFISSCREGGFSPSYHEHPVQCTVISLSQFHSGPHWSSLCIPTGIRFISEKPFLQLVLQLYNSQENFKLLHTSCVMHALRKFCHFSTYQSWNNDPEVLDEQKW